MNWLCEAPWWLSAAVVLIGIVLLVNGNRRQEKGMLRGGAAFAAGGILLGLLGFLLESPRETVLRRTGELTSAVADKRWDAVASLLHPAVSVGYWGNRDILLAGAKRYSEQYQWGNVRVINRAADDRETDILVSLRALTELEGLPVTSHWELDWVRDADDQWVVKTITPRNFGHYDQTYIERQYFGRP